MPGLKRSYLIVAILCCDITAAARAADAMFPGSGGVSRLAGPDVEFFIEADHPLSIDEITSPGNADRFTRLEGPRLDITRAAPRVWLRFRLDEKAAGCVFEVEPSFSIILEKIDLYLPLGAPGGAHTYTVAHTGSLRPTRKDVISSRFYLFEIPPGVPHGAHLYLRLESSMDVTVRFNLWRTIALRQRDVLYFLAFGIIYGILLGMIAYNFFIFASLRDRAYLYYILYMASALAWQFHVQGHTKMFFGRSPGVDLGLLWVLVGGVQLWGGVFSMSFLSLRKNLPRVNVVMGALASMGALVGAAGVIGWHRAAFGLSHVGGLLLPIAVIVAALLRLRQGFAPARYYILAWSFLASGGVTFALMGLKVLPVAFWSVNGVALGMAAESLLLSLALADRIRTLKEEKEFFEKSQKRYMELSITDSLTGLFNRRYLQSKLESEIQHSQRLAQPLSLVMLDLDDFKAVNDRNGHGFGDMVLMRLAATIRAVTREVDVACRYGGEEFVIIMPGTTKAYALGTAERIRTRFAAEPLITGKKQVETVTVSLGVAELAEGDTADALLECADRAMYLAKRMGKNRTAT
ncbi:MAG TPA: diguanylate cyclase [Spirochaetota bacterium]|nr:diguanylate cyclase [Spirochaetota bacterium]